MRVPGTLAHSGEELVDLFERQGVVQRLQRIDGGHHGAAFKACGRGETRRPRAHQPSATPALRKRSRQNHSANTTAPLPSRNYTSTRCPACCRPRPASTVRFHAGKKQKPCSTPRQHHTISHGYTSACPKHLAPFAKTMKSDLPLRQTHSGSTSSRPHRSIEVITSSPLVHKQATRHQSRLVTEPFSHRASSHRAWSRGASSHRAPSRGASSRRASSHRASSRRAPSRGASSRRVEPRGVESQGVESQGVESQGVAGRRVAGRRVAERRAAGRRVTGCRVTRRRGASSRRASSRRASSRRASSHRARGGGGHLYFVSIRHVNTVWSIVFVKCHRSKI